MSSNLAGCAILSTPSIYWELWHSLNSLVRVTHAICACVAVTFEPATSADEDLTALLSAETDALLAVAATPVNGIEEYAVKLRLADLVEDDEVDAGQVVRHASGPAGTRFGLQAVDQIDDVEEATAGAVADAGTRDGDGRWVLPVPVPPTRTTLRWWARKPPPARSRTRVSLIGVVSKAKSSISLASGSLARVIWYLIERAVRAALGPMAGRPSPRRSRRREDPRPP